VGLSFRNPDGVQYAVQLEGLEDDWRYVKDQSTMTYMNLSPGKYTFRVKASNSEGKWSDQFYEFPFEILPPFWQTWWFRILAVLIVPFVLAVIIRSRFKTVKRKAQLSEQMAELKMQALRAQMNPHFIFNALNSIQHLIVKNEGDLAFSYLSKFSRLLRMILNVSDKAFVSLEVEVEMLQLYLDLEALRFDHHMHYSIDVEEDDITGISIPTLLIQPYVENAIWHGLVPKTGTRELNITITATTDRLIISVKDNGIGRKRAAEIKSMQPIRYESKGMSINSDRLSIIGDPRQSKVEIIDLYNDNGEAAGTKVVISMPMQALMNRNI
jgi:LytS/YehU family sensor histidine kinase